MNSTSSANALRLPNGRHSHSTSTQLAEIQNEGSEADDSGYEGKHNQIDGDCNEDSIGGLSDCDERNGDERRYAKESPVKGKQRLTSRVCITLFLFISID
jgi:hypothetical protein